MYESLLYYMVARLKLLQHSSIIDHPNNSAMLKVIRHPFRKTVILGSVFCDRATTVVVSYTDLGINKMKVFGGKT